MRAVTIGALCACLILSGCTLAQVQSDIDKVLADLPTILSIAAEIITIVGAVKNDPNLSTALVKQATTTEAEVTSDLKTIQAVLTSYRGGLASAPANVLQKLDDAVAAVQENLIALQQAFHIVNVQTQAAVGAVVAAVGAFLLGVTSLIPVSVATQFFPKASRLLAAATATSGIATFIVPAPRTLAMGYNRKQPVNVAHVPVPWLRVLHVPVMP